MNLEALVCEYEGCNLIYEHPVTLPCGSSLCKQHLEKFKKNKFKCFFCSVTHHIPEDGFSLNKAMTKMIDSHFKLDPLRKKVTESFENLTDSIKKYEDIEPEVYIDGYFYEIRNKVDLHREELKKDIDDKSDEIIRILKEKEEKCKLNAKKIEKINLDELKQDTLPSFKQKFRSPVINHNQLNDLLSKMNQNIEDIEYYVKKFELDLLLNESIKFEKYEKSSTFGRLIIENIDPVLSDNYGELIKSYNGHSSLIRSIQLDENKNKLITGSEDNTIKIWDLYTRQCLRTLYDHTHWVTSLLIVANNKFVSGSEDKTIKIWDLNSYQCLGTIKNDVSVISLCLILENQIAIGCGDGSIKILNLENQNIVKTLKAHDDWIPYLLPIDNSKLISCSGEKDKKIKIWNSDTLECIKILAGHLDVIFFLELTLN